MSYRKSTTPPKPEPRWADRHWRQSTASDNACKVKPPKRRGCDPKPTMNTTTDLLADNVTCPVCEAVRLRVLEARATAAARGVTQDWRPDFTIPEDAYAL